MANPQWTNIAQNQKLCTPMEQRERLEGSSSANTAHLDRRINNPLSAKVPPAKPLKGCLKKTTSFPEAQHVSEEFGLDAKAAKKTRRRATSSHAKSSSKSGDRRRRHMRSRRSRADAANTDSSRKESTQRSSQDSTLQPPLKSILKKTESPTTPFSKPRRHVSFSEMSRWSSVGSGVNLNAMVQRRQANRAASMDNYRWSNHKATTESRSQSLSLSVVQETKKYQAPGRPSRRGSFTSNFEQALPEKKNLFQASVNDFQSACVVQERHPKQAPCKPDRRGSFGETPECIAPSRKSRISSRSDRGRRVKNSLSPGAA